ncbi:NUDIX domain-containing protein [Paracoccus saliphilus]|uniref:8-oxo-dGTP diphosphatase n=1 Tax=Paracoccus saliphilus TaxID=405559 RepID=A0AA45W4V4_9RHOB|nr:NUDIX hydrolase [Paracoccus saliphilus]WCR04691.1 NUDIX hydrolase [Paracoccus saliphilus]SIS88482.1 8-oxo-dGTP diphosphatase [Paracoccus saliphilus]
MIPRFGATPEPARHYRRRPGAYAILLREGQVLLTHQEEPEPEFQLPGGGIDPGEGPISALHREVMEETGWTISTPRRICAYRRYCYMPEYDLHAEKMCSVWLARPVMRVTAPLEPGHEAHWVSLDQALRLLPDPGSRAAIEMVPGRPSRDRRNCR